MKNIDKTTFVNYYNENLKDKNHGLWPDSSHWPELGVAYSINQYDSKGKTYDIIKFDEEVRIDEFNIGTKFILSGQRVTPSAPVRVDGTIF